MVFAIKDISLMMSCSWFKTTKLVYCNQHQHVSLTFFPTVFLLYVSLIYTEEMFYCVHAKYLEDVYLILRFWKVMYAVKSLYPYSRIFFFVYVYFEGFFI